MRTRAGARGAAASGAGGGIAVALEVAATVAAQAARAGAIEEGALALAIDGLAGGLYACHSLHAVRRLLFAQLLPAAGAPCLQPLGEAAPPPTAEKANSHPKGSPAAAPTWLTGERGWSASGRSRRLFGDGATCDSDAASDASGSSRRGSFSEPAGCSRTSAGGGGGVSACGGESQSAADVVAAMAAAVSACDCAVGPAAGAVDVTSLSADVRAIRREVGQTGQTVGEVLKAVRSLTQTLAALHYERS